MIPHISEPLVDNVDQDDLRISKEDPLTISDKEEEQKKASKRNARNLIYGDLIPLTPKRKKSRSRANSSVAVENEESAEELK